MSRRHPAGPLRPLPGLENRAGQTSFKAMRRACAEHTIEEVGEELGAMMPWIAKNRLVDKGRNERAPTLL